MFSVLRNSALAAIATMLVLGGAGQARATVLYSVSAAAGPAAFSWSAPTFITLPTNLAPGPDPITGLISCTFAGTPCVNTPTLTFIPGLPASIEASSGTGVGGFFLRSDFGAFGTYTDAFQPSRGTLTVSAVSAVPEPASLTLLAVGLAGLGVVLRTRRA